MFFSTWKIFDVAQYRFLPEESLAKEFNAEFTVLMGRFNYAKSPQMLWPELANVEGVKLLLDEFKSFKLIMWRVARRHQHEGCIGLV